jgi:hypothetical protein
MPTSNNLENNSEKLARGRPRLLHPELRAIYRQGHPERASERALQNTEYQMRAHGLLYDQHPELGWLFTPTYRTTILQALGRVEDPDSMVWMAQHLCRDRPKTREALVRIRLVRRGGLPPATSEGLTTALLTTLTTYAREHEGLHPTHVVQALTALDDWADLHMET